MSHCSLLGTILGNRKDSTVQRLIFSVIPITFSNLTTLHVNVRGRMSVGECHTQGCTTTTVTAFPLTNWATFIWLTPPWGKKWNKKAASVYTFWPQNQGSDQNGCPRDSWKERPDGINNKIYFPSLFSFCLALLHKGYVMKYFYWSHSIKHSRLWRSNKVFYKYFVS